MLPLHHVPILLTKRTSAFRLARLEIIKATHDKAVAEGDKRVWFLDASTFFPFDHDEHTVDGVHPTDLGFYLMAKGIEPTLRAALEKVQS